MNWALLAGGILASWVVIGFATWLYVHPVMKFTEPKPPTDDEVNRAIVDVVKQSLYDRPDQWVIREGTLVHLGGTRILRRAGSIAIDHEGATSILTETQAEEIIRACQVRNAKAMLKDLTKEVRI